MEIIRDVHFVLRNTRTNTQIALQNDSDAKPHEMDRLNQPRIWSLASRPIEVIEKLMAVTQHMVTQLAFGNILFFTHSLCLTLCMLSAIKNACNADLLIQTHTHMPICVNAIPVSFDLAVLIVYVQKVYIEPWPYK